METIPLGRRPLDIAIIGFFIFNAVFITYFFDLEQVVIPNTAHFTYPLWPPRFLVDLAHWWGKHYDPLLYARPVWWRATIWIDVLLFGPFYFVAIWAFAKGKNWIRLPGIIYSAVMLTNVTIILSEEIGGPYATPNLPSVVGANASWIIFPLLIIWRLWGTDCPFSKKKSAVP
ncbi:MAG TPA: emopamil-binding family protein [Chitinivibrionales bacterium]|nr:emopamil-binding family protein [Chitinivibrionales bacterium]